MSDDAVFIHVQHVSDAADEMQASLTEVAGAPLPAIPPDFGSATANETLAQLLGTVISLRGAIDTQVELAANASRIVVLEATRADDGDD